MAIFAKKGIKKEHETNILVEKISWDQNYNFPNLIVNWFTQTLSLKYTIRMFTYIRKSQPSHESPCSI